MDRLRRMIPRNIFVYFILFFYRKLITIYSGNRDCLRHRLSNLILTLETLMKNTQVCVKSHTVRLHTLRNRFKVVKLKLKVKIILFILERYLANSETGLFLIWLTPCKPFKDTWGSTDPILKTSGIGARRFMTHMPIFDRSTAYH